MRQPHGRSFLRLLACLIASFAVSWGCASSPDRIAYNSISGARVIVQEAVTQYKTHCNVKAHEEGPGTCPAVQYDKVREAYQRFQAAHALAVHGAAGISEGDWLALVSNSANDALAIIRAWRK
jgi:hypothetical protein